MSSSLGTLILILTFGGTSGNSVKQTDQITVLEGASVTMNCTYTSTLYPTLFWYVQYPNKALQFLQKETMENSKNFGARNIKDKTSPITKSSVQVSDSAVYYCLLRDTHSAKGREGICTKTSGAQVRCVVSLGTPRRGDSSLS
uniref:T cell receptor alpha variable 40 n=1 Tax=Suricata suricatta TaxID=37032 RepID=A0A673TFW2_SURSU